MSGDPSSQRRGLKDKLKPLMFAVVGLLVVAGILTFGYYVQLNRNSNEFIVKTVDIKQDLSSAIEDLYNVNFKQALDTTTSYNQARSRLERHITNLQDTKDDINSLKRDYAKLHPTKRNIEKKRQLDKMFSLAGRITSAYSTELEFRKSVYDAYGNLPSKLTAFADAYNDSRPVSELATQAKEVATLADDALAAIAKIRPSKDTAEIYKLRRDYLENTRTTFVKLNQYFHTGATQAQLNEVVLSYSRQTLAISDRVDSLIKQYVSKSDLAEDFAAFNKLADSSK